MHQKDAKWPVLQCEEFEACESTAPKNVAVRAGQRRTARKKVGVPSLLKGLCANCDNLDHCTYPKPEGGVWHCEEYV
jgi:hypothetical protein